MSLITIITPTYNRINRLPALYESLKNQTCKDFEWFVVDDGSTDGTCDYLEEISRENKISFKYITQSNGGKHRALNNGIRQINTELTFIVDSDDVLPYNSIEIILRYHNKYKDYNDRCKPLCGYSFLRCHEDGRVNTAYFPKDELIDSFCNVRINGNIAGDKAEVFYTDILKKYPFAEFEGEKFMPEDAVWMQMSSKYDMVHINENIYTCEYLEGGLTKTGRKMKINSPYGMMLRSETYLDEREVNLKTKLKMMLLLIIYSHFAACDNSKYKAKHGLGWYVCFLPASIIYLKWRKELENK